MGCSERFRIMTEWLVLNFCSGEKTFKKTLIRGERKKKKNRLKSDDKDRTCSHQFLPFFHTSIFITFKWRHFEYGPPYFMIWPFTRAAVWQENLISRFYQVNLIIAGVFSLSFTVRSSCLIIALGALHSCVIYFSCLHHKKYYDFWKIIENAL